MKVVLITPELFRPPTVRVDSLADASAALSKALLGIGYELSVVAPFYRHIDSAALSLAKRLRKIEADIGPERVGFDVFDGRTPAGIEFTLLGNDELFGSVSDFREARGAGVDLVAKRTAGFMHAVYSLLHMRNESADIVHALDWPGAACAAFLRHMKFDAAFVLSLTGSSAGPAFVGDALRWLTPESGLARNPEGALDVVLSGLLAADRIAVPSSEDLERLLRNAPPAAAIDADRLTSLRWGLDVSVWNPATDPHLPSRFDPVDRSGKARCKAALQRELGFPERPEVPLLVSTGTTDPDDGFDLLAEAAPDLLHNDIQWAVQIRGTEQLVGVFDGLAVRWPDRLQARLGSDELLHRMLGAADVLVSPARYEPLGLLAMCAHRYGALPVVLARGAARDVVVDVDAHLESGNGFLYDEPSVESLRAAVQRAGAAAAKSERFVQRACAAMRADYSWDATARRVEWLYKDALERGPDRIRPEAG